MNSVIVKARDGLTHSGQVFREIVREDGKTIKFVVTICQRVLRVEEGDFPILGHYDRYRALLVPESVVITCDRCDRYLSSVAKSQERGEIFII